MRVCMLSYSFYRSDTRVQQYAKALVERGDEVEVLSLIREGVPTEEIVDGVKVLGIQTRRRDERGPFDYLYRIVRFLIRSSIVLIRQHRARPYDLIHIHSVPDFMVFAALIPKLSGARVILDIHDILPELYASKFKVSQSSTVFRFLKLLERWSIAFAHHVIIANHLWYERLISRSLQREKCTPICNYPDLRYFFPHTRTRVDGKFIMMYPGTLNWHQGLDVAIKAFAKIVDQAPNAEFHIYGEGPTRSMLEDLAQRLGLIGKVHFYDPKPFPDIAPIMSQADLAVVPKRAESFGNEAISTKVLEFMALGIPVLQSRTKVGTYYDTDSRVMFFASENVDDLAKCMLVLIRDQQLRERLVANASEYVKENNWAVRKREYLALVDSLTNSVTRGEPTSVPVAVCIVVENLPVPVDRRVWREAQALRDAGYLVSVICPTGKSSFTAHYEILDGIHIYRHHLWEGRTPRGYLLEYAMALAAEFSLALKVFARTRFRILQACNPPDTIFLIALFFKLFGVQFIFDHHDLSPELLDAKFGKGHALFRALTEFAERCSFRVAKVSIATNESFRDVAVSRGGKRPEHVFVVRNCPDLTTFRRGTPRPEIKFHKPFMVVYVGFMGPQDGLHILLKSVEHIVKDDGREDTHFVLIGEGTVLPELRAMVARKNLNAYVTFTGQIPHEEVVTYLSNADVGVAPDPKNPLNDNSTMIKIFEYMALGLPVVLFDLKEGRRIAGPSALYAEPNDPIDFAHQITKLLNNTELRRKLGAPGRARIEESLNWETEKLVFLRAYQTALQSDHSS